MAYRYLKNRGALNEAETDLGLRPAAPAASGDPKATEQLLREIPDELAELVPESIARENGIVPLAFDGERLTFAAIQAEDIALADKLRFILAKDVRLVPARQQAIREAINRLYGQAETESVDSLLQEFTDADLSLSDAALTYSGEAAAIPAPAAPPRGAWRSASFVGRGARGPEDRVRRVRSPQSPERGGGMFFYVVPEGQRVLMRRPNGSMQVLVGPRRVWRGRNQFYPMQPYTAHPDSFLVVRYQDGRQEHLPGPAQVWFDSRVHLSITREEALQLSAKETVVVYCKATDSEAVSRRLVYGPTLFVPQPGEWLHTFSWHASKGGSQGAAKVANALVFQKLWLLPDQMYHDVHNVRTADDAVLTIHLMIFFELCDVERMLDSTHDPIGDFINAATSDVVGFTGRHDFEAFKRSAGSLNDLATYSQLTGRAAQCGYRINKVVFRGYSAADALQQMHDQAIQARTRLQLDRATEQQAQELENYKLECQLKRAGIRRTEQAEEVAHDLALAQKREEAEIRRQETRQSALRELRRLEQARQLDARRQQDGQQREHLAALRDLSVDLTAYLTQARADQVIELRGSSGHHVHLEPRAAAIRPGGPPEDGNRNA
jgi:hypothetical protein